MTYESESIIYEFQNRNSLFFLEWMQYFNYNRINQSQYTSIDVDSLRFMYIQIWKIQLLQINQNPVTQKMLQHIGSKTRHIAGLHVHGSCRCWTQLILVTSRCLCQKSRESINSAYKRFCSGQIFKGAILPSPIWYNLYHIGYIR